MAMGAAGVAAAGTMGVFVGVWETRDMCGWRASTFKPPYIFICCVHCAWWACVWVDTAHWTVDAHWTGSGPLVDLSQSNGANKLRRVFTYGHATEI
jgi:hypothetical protein